MSVIVPVRGPEVVVTRRWVPEDLKAKIRSYSPKSHLGKIVRECLSYLPAEQAAALLEAITQSVVMESQLAVVHIRWNDYWGRFEQDDYGVVSRKVITTRTAPVPRATSPREQVAISSTLRAPTRWTPPSRSPSIACSARQQSLAGSCLIAPSLLVWRWPPETRS